MCLSFPILKFCSFPKLPAITKADMTESDDFEVECACEEAVI